MKNKISFEGVGQVAATFYTPTAVKAGHVVKLSDDSTVAACAAGDKFCGVALTPSRGDCATVQLSGLAAVACADENVTVGYVTLVADGNGGVKKATTGSEYLVMADDGAGTIIIKM